MGMIGMEEAEIPGKPLRRNQVTSPEWVLYRQVKLLFPYQHSQNSDFSLTISLKTTKLSFIGEELVHEDF